MSDILLRAWVVVPAFREPGVIGEVVRGYLAVCPRVVVVDDGSGDTTGDEAFRAGAVVLAHIVNLGQGAALATGIEYALGKGAEYVFTADADGQHAPESLRALAERMAETSADVVLGSRWLGQAEGIPPERRLLLSLATRFTRWHTGLNLTDTHNGLRLFTARAAGAIRIAQPRMAHASEILSRLAELRLRYAEAPVTVRYTGYSLAKGQRASGLFRVLLDLFYSYWTG